ncbi:flagellar assembly protein FliW [Glaciihabitans sp. UYNi722]|uniref:flagellar assembly protein FliW n=1 Tax=Glaciihabitans sp. UYNi722 TaxID=3156344 RepID=UPI0033932CDF
MSATLTFVTPPPGLEPLLDFTLTDIEGANGLYSVRSVDNDAIRLFVIDAALYLPDYSPEITDEQGTALDLNTPEDAMVLVVANPGENGTSMNLMAPIIVNAKTGSCAQVILEGQDWPLRAELSFARSA